MQRLGWSLPGAGDSPELLRLYASLTVKTQR
jgi:hypothetical protein